MLIQKLNYFLKFFRTQKTFMLKNYKAKQGFTGCSNHSMVELRAANSLKSAGLIYT